MARRRQQRSQGRERILLDHGWRFALGHAADVSRDFQFARSRYLIKAGEAKGAAKIDFDDSAWRAIDLPHDWAIELPYDETGDKDLLDHGYHAIGPDHPQHSVGWYRKSFDLPASDDGRRISLEFDGVFRDSVVFVNGHYLGRHASGYTPFRYDITDVANYGGRNVVVVRVDASLFEGWWYEGAGIYRHVWLTKTDPLHVVPNGTVVTSKVRKDGVAEVTVRTTIANDGDEPATLTLTSTVQRPARHPDGSPGDLRDLGVDSRSRARDPSGRRTPLRMTSAASSARRARVAPWSSVEVTQKLCVKKPRLWSPHEPNLYALNTTITRGRAVTDTDRTPFGIRTTRWDANRGFFLNGQPLKIKGFCCHEDHAGVGVAVPDAVHEFRIRKLKETGANAYRAAHNCASPIVLDLCDRLGLLVMAETRQAGSHPEALDDLSRMIVRDRNHPSIILWSIGNEEHTIQWKPVGERIGRSMKRLIRKLDPIRPITAAMHDRSSAEGFGTIVDVHGWNYIAVGDIESFRKSNPRTPIVGSEESSVMTTRGVYADDPVQGYCAAYDRRTPKWGTTAEKWWTYFAERPWLAGGFAWTGFDHRGEPIAYKWPNVVSHFGVMDFCGFEKDNFYYYQAWWSDPRERTVLHLFPHWTWPGREGETIDVQCYSNCDEVELFLNGASLGRQPMPRNAHLAWPVKYEPGVLEAHGYRAGQRIAMKRIETTGAPQRIVLKQWHGRPARAPREIGIVTVSSVDATGRFCPTADLAIDFTLTGPGRIFGLGNGDPSDHTPHASRSRNLFNGLCQVMSQATASGRIVLAARADGLPTATLGIRGTVKRPP
ncbi:MAG: glycoside hydrolase family 2 TIM barrel-domain containing protein [Tepidisphaeraceae bacterium]